MVTRDFYIPDGKQSYVICDQVVDMFESTQVGCQSNLIKLVIGLRAAVVESREEFGTGGECIDEQRKAGTTICAEGGFALWIRARRETKGLVTE